MTADSDRSRQELLRLCEFTTTSLAASAIAAYRLVAGLVAGGAPCFTVLMPTCLQKLATQREAVASAKVLLGAEVFHLVATSSMKKGDVLTVRHI